MNMRIQHNFNLNSDKNNNDDEEPVRTNPRI